MIISRQMRITGSTPQRSEDAVARLIIGFHNPLLGQMRQREGGCAAFESVVAVLPGDAVKDDGSKLMACGRKVRFSDAAQNGAGGQCHLHVVLF
jgi:hypothetical protein